jgi:hypothetical protein
MISRKFAGKGEKVGVGKMWNEALLPSTRYNAYIQLPRR